MSPFSKTCLLQFIVLALLFEIELVNSQNLVPNPSYELFDKCPDNQNQIPYAIGWLNFCLTPDYFNACSQNPDFSVPFNLSGSFQNAASGEAYAGLYTTIIAPGVSANAREYIGIKLISPLKKGTKYYACFKVSQGQDNSNTYICSTNNIGILFTTEDFSNYGNDSISNPGLLKNNSQVNFPNVLTDTINWTTVGSAFQADSNYSYLCIGNFYSDEKTNIIKHKDPEFCLAYYYIDDVSVIELPETDEVCFKFSGNLSGNYISIKFNDYKTAGKVSFKLNNILGQNINNFSFIPEQEIESRYIDYLSSGLYIITIESNCKTKQFKFLII